MARTARTPFALLGLFMKRDLAGYDVHAQFESAQYIYWSEGFGQIYPAIKALLSSGELVPVRSIARGGVPKKIYGITEAGAAHLTSWMETDTSSIVVRDELVLRVHFGSHIHPEFTRGLLELELDRIDAQLDELELVDVDRLSLFEKMAWDWSWIYLDERGVWCEECLERIDALTATDGISGST